MGFGIKKGINLKNTKGVAQYFINFLANGGSGTMDMQRCNTYKYYKLNENKYTRTGYLYQGWNRDNSTRVEFANGATIRNLSKKHKFIVNLYAIWKAITYTIAYNGNGNTGGSTSASSHTYDVSKNLTANGFSKTGYLFNGWATTSTGAKVYNNQHSVVNLNTTQGGTTTLYAKWTPINYIVVYNGNGNTGGYTASSDHVYDTSKALTANGYIKTGYLFNGWSTTTNGATQYSDRQSVVNLNTTNGGTTNLYVVWKPITYYLSFNGNGNTDGSMSNQTLNYDTAYNISPNAFVRSGYHFNYWTDANGIVYHNTQAVINLTTVNGQTIPLYANWGRDSAVLLNTNDAFTYYWHLPDTINGGGMATATGFDNKIDCTDYTTCTVRINGNIDSTPSGMVADHQWIRIGFTTDYEEAEWVVHKQHSNSGLVENKQEGPASNTWYDHVIDVSNLTGFQDLNVFVVGAWIAKGTLFVSKITMV